ncbi:hypothetical protein ACLOAU_06490 [Niabella sp. CJ426]|uniref:hypothetical protein n=1 Tax=Niabella sp. CJ426 TaxID=3393740 RepID=UPI003D0821FE
MKPTKRAFHAFFFFLFSLAAMHAAAQKNTEISPVDSSATASSYTTFTLASLFSSGIDYFGQTTAQTLPYIALNGTLRLKYGIYASLTGFHLFSDSAVVSATGLTAGYQFTIAPKFTGDISYAYTIFPKQSPFLQASSPHMVSAAFNYEHLLNTGISADYSFGRQQDFFVSLSNSKELVLNTDRDRHIIATTPQLTIVAGTQQFYETYLVERKNNGKGKGAPPPREESRSYNQFGLLSYNFKLPLSYNRASYLVEAAYQLSLLGNNASERAGQTNSFFTLGFYYQF